MPPGNNHEDPDVNTPQASSEGPVAPMRRAITEDPGANTSHTNRENPDVSIPQAKLEDLDAVSNAISRVLTPVMICMALSVWLVHSLGDPNKCPSRQDSEGVGSSSANPGTNMDSSNIAVGLAVGFICIFVVLMVVFTFLVVWLYKSGRQKIIQGWLMLAVFVIFAYVGGLYIYDFCRSRCINVDWITIVLAAWNFAIGGLVSVFGTAPRLVNQGYLIVMSSLMAYIFRTLPDFAVWIILGLLVLWDLFAVLSPCGPLRMLVEVARERGDDLPALVYDTNPVAAGRQLDTTTTQSKPSTRKHDASSAASPSPQASPPTVSSDVKVPALSIGATAPLDPRSEPAPRDIAVAPSGDFLPQAGPSTNLSASRAATTTVSNDNVPRVHDGRTDAETIVSERRLDSEGVVQKRLSRNTSQTTELRSRRGKEKEARPAEADPTATARNPDGEVQVGTLGTHLKLGLGDFVFYSILVAQASKSGTMTTIASFVAILAGLCATLFLVTVRRKALPALPISITAGLITFFLIRHTVLPFVNNLLPELLFY